MPVDLVQYKKIRAELEPKGVVLVAVSKIKTEREILELYNEGQRDFGENYVQELVEKQENLPKDIRWHFLGHLQRNKVKYIAPFVHLIHGVDSISLLKEINKEGLKNNRQIHCLLQVHIAQEETKFGFGEAELMAALQEICKPEMFKNTVVDGLMGMASFSDDQDLITREMDQLHTWFKQHSQSLKNFSVLSMGMSGDYKLAIEKGSNMVRIGSLLFGARL